MSLREQLAPSWLGRHKNLNKKVNCLPEHGACYCDQISLLPKLYCEQDGRRHILCTFEEWKDAVRIQLPDTGKKERWCSSLTSSTRVAPTLDWALATVRQNAKRSLRKKFKDSSTAVA